MLAIFILFRIYLDRQHVQLYFAIQFGHLCAKFASENVKKTSFVNFRYLDITSLMTSQLRIHGALVLYLVWLDRGGS